MNASLFQSDAEILGAMLESAYEELQFFSNKGKQGRERWVVSQFLERYQLAFVASELTSPHQQSKTDVRFRDANFQVKEILTPGSKRSDEVKATYEGLKRAKKLVEVRTPQFAYDVPPPTSVYALVSAEAANLASEQKYRGTKVDLDLLFYVTRIAASPIRDEEIDSSQLARLGWRSISCLAGAQATVLVTQPHAPAFLRAAHVTR